MNEKIYSLKAFSGLCENPDGDTKLRFGQASVCRNFAVTRDGNLRRCIGNRNHTKQRNYPAEEISNDGVKRAEKSVYTSGENFCGCAGNKKQIKQRNYPAKELFNREFKGAKKSAWANNKVFCFRADCKKLVKLGSSSVRGSWHGLVKGAEELICTCVDKIRKLIKEQNCEFSCW